MAHALGRERITRFPALAIAGAIAAALAGITQAAGLLRWVLVVPGLAATSDIQSFALIDAFGGVVRGEHLGQLVTALHIVLIALIQLREPAPVTAALGGLSACAIILGATEGPVAAMGGDGQLFGRAAVAGYMGFAIWLLAAARGYVRTKPAA